MSDRPPYATDFLTVEVCPRSHAIVLVIDGEIDMSTAPLLEQAIGATLDGGDAPVELDLANVSFADSSALAVLLRARHQSGARLVVGPCSASLERLFCITGVNRLLGRTLGSG